MQLIATWEIYFVFYTSQLNNSESLQQQMDFLNKQLLLLGEANKLSVQEVQRLGPDSHKASFHIICMLNVSVLFFK